MPAGKSWTANIILSRFSYADKINSLKHRHKSPYMQIDLLTLNKIVNHFRGFRKLSIAMIQLLWNCTNMSFTGNGQVAMGLLPDT